MIEVDIKGYKLYCESDDGELYDFFIPSQKYRLTKKDADQYVPVSHTLLTIKRDSKTFQVDYEKFKKISEEL